MQHGRPRLNLFARQLPVDRVQAGWMPATAAEASGVSRATAYKWLRRFRHEGGAGLLDRRQLAGGARAGKRCRVRLLDQAQEAFDKRGIPLLSLTLS